MKPIEILLVEDSPTDIELTLEALKEARLNNNVTVIENGVDALLFLKKQGPYAQAPTPDLILLDLNLPRKDGHEVLAEIKADKTLDVIPIVILTTSQQDEDIVKSYKLHANCYIVKPVDFDQFMNAIRAIEDFWFTVVKLPKS